jgi:hypothetical protein
MEMLDLAKRLRKRFPQSLRSMTAQGIAAVLDAMPEQELAELQRQLDERDAKELQRTLACAQLPSIGPPGRPEKARPLRVIPPIMKE